MVGGFVEDQDVRAGDHHLGQQAADLFPSGKYPYFFHAVFSGEEHTSQEAADIGGVFDLRIAGQPVRNGQIIVKFFGAVLGEICLGGSYSPFIGSLVRLHFAHQNLEQDSFRTFVPAYKGNFVFPAQSEGEIVQNFYTVDGFGKSFYHQNFISNLSVGTEVNVRIFPAGRAHLIQLDLFQGAFSGGRLFGFGSIGRETGDKFLEFFDLLLFLAVGFFHLLNEQLAGLIPEVVVSGIELDLAIVDICRMGTDLVQEVTVMGYHDNGVFKVDQEFLQPFDGVQVQMVGRLVQKQDIRISEKRLRQQDFHLFAAF